MFTRIVRWIEAFFTPAFELLGHLPPSALTRIATPF